MSLQVAPCPRCRSPIVFGERQCRSCAQPFNYGATPPPEPSPEQVQHAIATLRQQMAAQQQVQQQQAQQQQAQQQQDARQRAMQDQALEQAAARRANTAAGAADFVDTGRFDSATAGEVEPEEIPGFVDSSLFAAYTPKTVNVAAIEGLEKTARDEVGEVAVQRSADMVPTSAARVGEVTTEDIPGFIDSSLFAKFTPDHVDVQLVDGLDIGGGGNLRKTALPSAAGAMGASRGGRPGRRLTGEGDLEEIRCVCGAKSKSTRCPACGTIRK